jgi:hypothetical protein
VRRLSEALGVTSREGKVAAYYNDMEHGRLPAAGVSSKVIEALAGIVGADPETIRRAGRATTPPAPATAPGVLYTRTARREGFGAESRSAPLEMDHPAAGGRDEVDELFTGG